MDYNINFKYKSGGGTASSGMGAIAGMRQKAIQASQKQGATGTLRPDDNAKKLIDTNIKLSTNILKLNQSITMLTGVIKNRGLGGGGGGGSPSGPQGNTGLGSVGAALGYVGVPVALAGFAVQKINQIGNAYIEKVSQQKGTVGVGGFKTERVGAYLGPEVSSAYKAHRMAGGRFNGEIDPMSLKMGTIFGQSAEEVGTQSGQISRFGLSYGSIASTGAAAGIETELPKFMQAIAGELEDAVKKGINASDMSSDIGEEIAGLTANTRNQSVEMAMSIVGKTRASKESAAKGQIGGMESLMTWKAGQSKLMEQLNASGMEGKLRKSETINKLVKQGLLTNQEADEIFNKENVDEQFLRSKIGQGGYTSLVRDQLSGMSGAESARLSMKEVQKLWGGGTQAFRQWNAMYPGMGGELSQNELMTVWKTAQDPKKFDKVVGQEKLQKKFKEVEGSAPLLGVQKAQMMDDLLYKYGNSFASASLKMEKELIKLADSIGGIVIPTIQKAFGKKQYTPQEKKRLTEEYNSRWDADNVNPM